MSRATVDLPGWVTEVTDEPRTRAFREAVHSILHALESLPGASPSFALKGAVLLSLRYGYSRMTKDVDFSTPGLYRDFEQQRFLDEFGAALTAASEALPYGLACRVQSHEVDPPGVAATYQTLHLKVGYARKTEAAQVKSLGYVAVVDFS